MKQIVLIFLLSVVSVSGTNAQIKITNQVSNDIGRSQGFYLGQKQSLMKISTDFPALARVAQIAESEFSIAFGDSLDEIDARMSALNKPEWQKLKAGMARQIAESIAHIRLTQNEAEQFVQVVHSRAKGDLPSPVIETLLMFNPQYQRNPAAEFRDGYRQKYENDGQGKAKGVAFNLEAPRSWRALEGKRPNTVAKFISENGRGLELFLVLIKSAPLIPGVSVTNADIAEILNPKDMSEMLPEGSVYQSSGQFTLETLPGYWVRFDVSTSRGRQPINMSSIMYSVFYKNRMISMQGQVSATGGDGDDSGLRFEKYEKLFDLIAQSLILPEIYGQ